MTIFRLLAFLMFLPAAAWAGYLPPPGPVAAPNCTGGNSVLGYTTPGTALNCGTGVSSGSIGNGTPPNVGVYSGTNTISDSGTALSTLAPLASPTFTGTPAAPTPATADNSTKLATTAYVKAQGYFIGGTSLGGVLGGTLPNPTMAAGAAATNVGTLGGDLVGTLPNPTVANIRTIPVCAGTPSDTQILTYSSTDSCWEAKAAPTSGINQLHNDVSAGPGTGNQAATVVALQGRPVASTAPTTGQCLVWNGSQWAPGTCGTAPSTNYLLIATGSSFLIQTGSHLLIQ